MRSFLGNRGLVLLTMRPALRSPAPTLAGAGSSMDGGLIRAPEASVGSLELAPVRAARGGLTPLDARVRVESTAVQACSMMQDIVGISRRRVQESAEVSEVSRQRDALAAELKQVRAAAAAAETSRQAAEAALAAARQEVVQTQEQVTRVAQNSAGLVRKAREDAAESNRQTREFLEVTQRQRDFFSIAGHSRNFITIVTKLHTQIAVQV